MTDHAEPSDADHLEGEEGQTGPDPAEVRAKNIFRVTFVRFPVKKIVSCHSGTVLASDTPTIQLSPSEIASLTSLFHSKAQDGNELTRQLFDDIMRIMFPIHGDKKLQQFDELVRVHLLKSRVQSESNEPAEDLELSFPMSLQSFLSFIQLFYAPAFSYGQHLRLYAARNETESLRQLILRGCGINTANGEGLTALHFACEHNHARVLDTLLALHDSPPLPEQWCDMQLLVNAQDKHGWTPLHSAVHHNSADCVNKLLQLAATPLVHTFTPPAPAAPVAPAASTPAAAKGAAAAAAAAAAAVPPPPVLVQPLHLTQQLGLTTTKEGWSVLHLAVAQQRTHAVHGILHCTATLPAEAVTPHLLAALRRQQHLLLPEAQTLDEETASLTQQLRWLLWPDRVGRTSLHVCALRGHTSLFEELSALLDAALLQWQGGSTATPSHKGSKRKQSTSSSTSSLAGAAAAAVGSSKAERWDARKWRDTLGKTPADYLQLTCSDD